MARTCGIRIGTKRFELVVLEGGPKKHKVVASASGELPRDGDDPVGAAAKVIADALKATKAPVDDVMVALDTGLGAFRTHKVQLSDRAKIEETLKFDVEGEFPHLTIDDAIVDFEMLDSAGESSLLLVTAVKKDDIKRNIDLLAKAGAEPMEAELEATAMYNAAHAAGLLVADKAQVLVHVGEHATCVVVVDGGKLREVRAIPFGAHGAASSSAAAPVEGDAVPAAPAPVDEAKRALQAAQRIRRELARTVAGARTANAVEAVLICGLEVPGLLDEPILDFDTRRLEAFTDETGRPDGSAGEFVVAYGAAVRQLGGAAITASLRREELRYSGTWERLELPLMVLALLLLLGTGVWYRFLGREQEQLSGELAFWRDSARNFLVPEAKSGRAGYVAYPSPDFVKLLDGFKNPENETPPADQLASMQRMLQAEVLKLEKDLGQDAEIQQPQSALTGLSAVLGVLDSEIAKGTRPSLRKLASTYTVGRGGKGDHVHIVMDLTFFADDSVTASQQFESFKRALRSEAWFREMEDKQSKSIEGGKGISIQGFAVDVDCSKIQTVKS